MHSATSVIRLLVFVSAPFMAIPALAQSRTGTVDPAPPGFEVEAVLEVGLAPHQIRFSEDGATAYVASAGSDHIAVIDVERRERLRTIPSDRTPLGLALLEEGRLLVSRFRADTLGVLAPDGSVVDELHVGGGPSLLVGPVPASSYLVSVESEDVVRVVAEVPAGRARVTRSYRVGSRPFPAAATKDGRLAFVPSYGDGTVTVLDLWNERVRDVVPVGARPSGGVVTTDGLYYAVAVRGANEVALLDTSSFHVTHVVRDGVGEGPFSVAASPDGRYLFVNNTASDDVTVLDAVRLEGVGRIAVGATPIALAVHPGGESLWVASEGSHTVSVIRIPRATPAAMAGPSRPSRPTEVAVLGMIHGRHRESPTWSLAHVRETIREFRPDVICAEIPPNRMRAADESFRRSGFIEESRVVRFPEYTDVVFALREELGYDIVPCAGWTQEMSDLRRSRIAEFETSEATAERNRDYERDQAEARAGAPPRERMEDPRFIHSDGYDDVMRRQYEVYDRYLNDWIGPGGWTHINEAHYALVERTLRDRPGERVLITFGGAHKYWMLDQLRERDDVTLVELREFLPGDDLMTTDDESRDMDSRAREEVFELHQFFEDWFGGVVPRDGGLARFEGVLADDFEIIAPDGGLSSREAIVARLESAHGVHRDRGVRIWVENFRSRPLEGGARLATYEEWQRIGGETRARLSTVVFSRAAGTPNGLAWRHVHETWLPDPR